MMTFDELVQLAMVIDPQCVIFEDEEGLLNIATGWRVVGDNTVPLAYDWG